MDTNPIIDKLFSAGAHFGYAPSRRHPSTSRFIFGEKGGVELIDLEQTAKLLAEALEKIKQLAAEKKTILFVSGKPEAREALRRAAERIGAPFVAGRWIGGSLTNWPEIRKRLQKLEEQTSLKEKGELAKFTKRERLLIDRELVDLEEMFGGLKGMSRTPDALFVIDPKREAAAVTEARKLNIPVIAIMNTDCNGDAVDFAIPANDASRDTVTFILDEVTRVYTDATPKE